MTPAQSKLVADYKGYALSIRRNLFNTREDEYDGVALEALCKAAMLWKPEGGSFAGFVRVVVSRALINFHRQWHREIGRADRKKKWQVLSIDFPIKGDEDDNGEMDFLGAFGIQEGDPADNVAESVDTERALECCSPRIRSRVVRYAAGHSMKEIAEEDGVTAAAVSRCFATEANRTRLPKPEEPSLRRKSQ